MGVFCDECAGECAWYVFSLSLPFSWASMWLALVQLVMGADFVGGVGSHANATAIL